MGERLVDKFLADKGFISYSPKVEGAHPFDRLCASNDKRTVFVAEVKSKARRTFYPDTGIDKRHLCDYRGISNKYNMHVFIFFVDEGEKRIYGNWIHELMKPRDVQHKGRILKYPLEQGAIVFFPLEAMLDICAIDGVQANELRGLSQRNYQYAGEA